MVISRILSIAAASVLAICIALYMAFVHVNNYLVGGPLPPLKVQTLAGKPATFAASHRAEVVVVFATWCDDCQREMPSIAAVADQFRGRADFTAIDQAESGDKVERFLQTYRFGGAAFIDPAGNTFGVFDIPTVFIIDKHGVVRERITGGVSAGALRAKLDAALRA